MRLGEQFRRRQVRARPDAVAGESRAARRSDGKAHRRVKEQTRSRHPAPAAGPLEASSASNDARDTARDAESFQEPRRVSGPPRPALEARRALHLENVAKRVAVPLEDVRERRDAIVAEVRIRGSAPGRRSRPSPGSRGGRFRSKSARRETRRARRRGFAAGPSRRHPPRAIPPDQSSRSCSPARAAAPRGGPPPRRDAPSSSRSPSPRC